MAVNTYIFPQISQAQRSELAEFSDESSNIPMIAWNILNTQTICPTSARPSTQFGYLDDEEEVPENISTTALPHLGQGEAFAQPVEQTASLSRSIDDDEKEKTSGNNSNSDLPPQDGAFTQPCKQEAPLVSGYIDSDEGEEASEKISDTDIPPPGRTFAQYEQNTISGYIDAKAENGENTVTSNPHSAETITHSITFSSAQTVVFRSLTLKLQNQGIPKADANHLARTVLTKLSFNPNQSRFNRTTKAAANNEICMGFATRGPHIFFHEKMLLGTGHIKITFSAFVYNLNTEEITPIVHQKIKKRTETIVLMTTREAKLQMHLTHPNIVEVHAFNTYGAPKDIKMAIYAERCDCDLKHALSENQLNFFEKIAIAIDIASALTFIHSQNYSHNDVKPDNILLKGKRGKLSDFGLCFANIETSANFVGFPKIQPPEQKKLKTQYPSMHSDVYQYGLTLWHLFHPNPPSNHLDDHFQYPNDMFKDWPCCSKQDHKLQALIRSCLEEKPNLRPSMAQVKCALQDI